MKRFIAAMFVLALLALALVVKPLGDSWTKVQAGDSWTGHSNVVVAGDSWTFSAQPLGDSWT